MKKWSEVKNFILQKRYKIFNVILDEMNLSERGRVLIWLENVFNDEPLMVDGAFFRMGKMENLPEDSLLIAKVTTLELKLTDEELSRKYDIDRGQYKRTKEHYKYDRYNDENNYMTEEEAWEEYTDVLWEKYDTEWFLKILDEAKQNYFEFWQEFSE